MEDESDDEWQHQLPHLALPVAESEIVPRQIHCGAAVELCPLAADLSTSAAVRIFLPTNSRQNID